MISGFIVDPDRKKMSKSKGNVVVPSDVLDKYGADAVRWRAAMARPGLDSPFDESQMKVGRRLAMKVLNASKFVLGNVEATDPDPQHATEPVDRALLQRLGEVCRRATAAFDAYDYTTALEVTEKFFWEFCDDYLELVKERAYAERPRHRLGQGDPGLRADTSSCACSRRSCPTRPRRSGRGGRTGSVHHASWPTGAGLQVPGGDPAVLDAVAAALTGIRGAKSEAKASMRAELSRVEITGPAAAVRAAETAADDLRKAGKITGELIFTVDDVARRAAGGRRAGAGGFGLTSACGRSSAVERRPGRGRLRASTTAPLLRRSGARPIHGARCVRQAGPAAASSLGSAGLG